MRVFKRHPIRHEIDVSRRDSFPSPRHNLNLQFTFKHFVSAFDFIFNCKTYIQGRADCRGTYTPLGPKGSGKKKKKRGKKEKMKRKKRKKRRKKKNRK